MKKSKLEIPYLLFIIIYSLLLYLTNITIGTNFIIGLLFSLLSLIIAFITSIKFCRSKSFGFPTNLSELLLSLFYLLLTIIINHTLGRATKFESKTYNLIQTKEFIIYELIVLIVFAVIYIILVQSRKKNIKNIAYIKKGNSNAKQLSFEIKALVEKTKSMRDSKPIAKKLEQLNENIIYSNTSGIDDNVLEDVEKLLSRIDKEIVNSIEIETNDYSSIDSIIEKINIILLKKN